MHVDVVWSCECEKHTYSVTFVSNVRDPNEEKCVRCGVGPIRLHRTTIFRTVAIHAGPWLAICGGPLKPIPPSVWAWMCRQAEEIEAQGLSGNIMIELHWHQGKPSHHKVSSNLTGRPPLGNERPSLPNEKSLTGGKKAS